MKNNGYLRRFLALFLAFVMIMADSSVTTFAATVGRVQRKSVQEETTDNKYTVQVNVDPELDLESCEYKYITIGSRENSWNPVAAKTDVVPLKNGTIELEASEEGSFNLYLVKGINNWEWYNALQDGDEIKQNGNRFRVSVTADENDASNLTLNISKVEINSYNVQITAGEGLDFAAFINKYQYAFLGKETSSGIEKISTVEKIDSESRSVVLKVDDYKDEANLKLYFIKNPYDWNEILSADSKFKQDDTKFKITVTKSADNTNNLNVSIAPVQLISYNVQITADADFDFTAFANTYKYAFLGKETSSEVEAVSRIADIDSSANNVDVKVEEGVDTTGAILYFAKGKDNTSRKNGLVNGSEFKQGNYKFKVIVTADANNANNLNVNMQKVEFKPGKSVDYRSVLGNALHFGIVANDFTCKGDLEANLAVGTLHGSGNMKSSKNNGGNGTTLIGDYKDSGWFTEKNGEGGQGDLIIYTTAEAAKNFSFNIWSKGLEIDTETYTKEELQEIVQSMVSEAGTTSTQLVANGQAQGLKYSEAVDENGVIDLMGSPDGTYYINFENGEFAGKKLKFKLTEGQNVVLNIPDDYVSLNQYNFELDGENYWSDGYASNGIGEKACEKIIYNLYNATTVKANLINGTVIAPRGDVENPGVSAGWIVANSATSGGSEWHCLSKDIPVVTSYALKAKKTVDGKSPSRSETNKFSFNLYQIDDKGNETLVDTKSNGDGGLVMFDTFGNITQTGTYWYKIEEADGTAGYTTDSTVYYAEVIVKAVSSNGVIISKNATVTYHKGSKDGAQITVPSFNNVKKKDETSANINVKKTFTNGAVNKTFEFKLTASEDTPMPADAENGEKTIAVSQNDGVQSFGEIKYTKAGTYTYQITEDTSSQEEGIDYDGSIWTVVVEVPKDFSTPTVTYSKDGNTTSAIAAEFVNSSEEQKGSLKIVKAAGDDTDLDRETFYFKVTDAQGNVVKNGDSDVWSVTYDKTNAENSISIDNLEPGIYTIEETDATGKTAVTGKDFPYIVFCADSVRVVAGTSTNITVTNTKYKATGSLNLTATKNLSGKDLKADAYSFNLLDKDGKVLQTKTNAADGSVTFDSIPYNLEDAGKDFTYTVEEVKGSEAGVAYDSSKYTVVAKVRDNDKNGNLTVTTEVTKMTETEEGSQTEPANAIVFNNKYEATGSLDLTATKQLSGKTLEAGKYSFVVKDSKNNVLRTATNAQNGDVTFDPINYTLEDDGNTYTYYVSEVKGSEAGVTYDETVYTVTVTISDKGDGTLKVEKTIEKDGTSVSAMTFQNEYTATGSLNLRATKNLSGKALKADAYSFNLLDKDGEVLQTKTNAADGSVTFDSIPYNLEDAGKDFTYTVEEVKGNEAGVAYDSSKYTVVAKVRDNNKNGILTVTTEVTKTIETEEGAQTEPANAIVFNNKYEATGSLDLTATKNLSGKTLEAGKYSFVVKDSENNVLRTATNAQNGDVTFDPINYTLEDDGNTYTYYVSEIKGTEAGVTYDETVYTVTVTISDKEDGTLKVEKSIEVDGAPAEGMTFQNEYTATGSLDLVASKQLIGREFQAGDNWTFTVTSDTNDAPMPERTSVTTDATSGNTDELNFGTINYTLKDAGKTYVYRITESGNVDGVTNDPELTRTVTVTISDNHDGSLNIEKVVKKGDGIETGIVFYNEYETIDITGTKTWNDNGNESGKRPASITVNLLADGEKVAGQTVTAETNWTYSFKNLPVYKGQQKLTYTISEEPVDDYTTEYDGYNITNRYTPGETSATVMKVWNDADNQDGKRPASITVSLLANGEPTGKTVTLDVDNNWQDTITGLQEKANGQLIEYTWSEDVPAGYELTTNKTEGQVTTLTNTHTPETTDIAGTKIWNDNDNENGNRPDSITVNLLADGVVIDSKVVKAADNWNYSFRDLPVYKDQKQITYTVTEETVTGYQSSVTNYDITNTEIITKVEGSKTWSDNDNKDGNRPASITVNLLADGIKIASKEVSKADNWSYSFDNLPVYKNRVKVAYTITEEPVADYTPEYTGYNITNSYTPGETSATVMKVWNDANNQDGKRPTIITVSLLANGEPTGTTVTLNDANNWQDTVTGLQEKVNGQLIEYTWSEDVPAGYELTTNKTEGQVTTLTNTHAPETTDISGIKTWNDNNNENSNRPDSITVNLLADGVKVDSQTVTADNNWAYSFKDLPVYKDQKQITYTVSEETVTGYNSSITDYDITNTEETTKVEGTKIWSDSDNQDGKRPTSITVNLLANGEKVAEQTVTADTNWIYSFDNLPVYKDQQKLIYTISEEPVADYTTEYDGYNITNSYTPGKTSATITKIWNDAENQDGKRPENITVSLLADGEATGTTVTLNADNNWTETVTDLPEKANGQAIEYTWKEENVPEGYQLTGNNNVGTVTTLTNTYTPETTSVTGAKTWSDNNQTAKRPLSIIVRLFTDGTEKASQTVTAGEDGTWTYSFNDLPKYTAGKEIAYTVSEDPVPGYVTSTDGYNITNTITSIKVSKVDVADGKELEGAHIQLLDQDGNVVEEWDSTKEAHEVTGLKTGAKYTLRETVAPDGYALTSDTTFVLKEDGTVDKDNTSTTISQEGVLLVEDSLATSPSIAVTKKLTYIGENLTARDQTFYVALYSDEACTQRVSDVKAIEFKNVDSSTVTFTDNIAAKKTYYIAECTADGTAQSSGTLADGTIYAANFNEGNSAVVEDANGTTTVTFENVFSSFPDGFYKQGQLTVTKKLLGADGDTKNSSKVFYAGIFDDADYTQLSTRVDRNIVALDLGGGNEVSETVNVGLEENGEVTLYVTETDVNGNPVAGSEGFGYKVSVSADSVTFDTNNLAASVVITNQEETTETITPTPTETPSNGGGENNGETPSENHGGSSTKSPKTGDNTPVEMYLVLLLAAAMLVVETERRRRKSKRQ